MDESKIVGPASAIKFIREQLGCGIMEAKSMYQHILAELAEDERRRFAGLALNGILASSGGVPTDPAEQEVVAKFAVKQVDALIKALESE